MGDLLGILGVLLGLGFLASPIVALITSLSARRRVEELESRIFTLERELDLLRSRPAIERKLQAPAEPGRLASPSTPAALPAAVAAAPIVSPPSVKPEPAMIVSPAPAMIVSPAPAMIVSPEPPMIAEPPPMIAATACAVI